MGQNARLGMRLALYPLNGQYGTCKRILYKISPIDVWFLSSRVRTIKESDTMKETSMRRWVKRVNSWRLPRPAVLCTGVGAVLGLMAVTLSAINAVSAQQAIALALPAGVTITVGLINVHVADALAAWRRGFQQGCQACKLYQMRGVNAGLAAMSGRPGRHGQRGG